MPSALGGAQGHRDGEPLEGESNALGVAEPGAIEHREERLHLGSSERGGLHEPNDRRGSVGSGHLVEREEDDVMCGVGHTCASTQHLLVRPVSGVQSMSLR